MNLLNPQDKLRYNMQYNTQHKPLPLNSKEYYHLQIHMDSKTVYMLYHLLRH